MADVSANEVDHHTPMGRAIAAKQAKEIASKASMSAGDDAELKIPTKEFGQQAAELVTTRVDASDGPHEGPRCTNHRGCI